MDSIVFVAWSRLSRRTRDLAREINAKLVFIPDRAPYFRAWRETGRILGEIKPKVVLVQLPQGPLLWRILGLAEKHRFLVVADTHTGFLVYSSLRERILNQPFRRLLGRARLVLVHNEPIAGVAAERYGVDKKKLLVVYDPLPRIPVEDMRKPILPGLEEPYLVVPSSWAPDEPLLELVDDFLRGKMPSDYRLVITGDPRRGGGRARRILRLAERNKSVIVTGFLPLPEYYWLLSHSKAIIALTRREYTMLSAIWEAVALSKPFIASSTRTLHAILGEDYPCFYTPRKTSLMEAVSSCSSRTISGVLARLRRLSENSIRELKSRLQSLD